MATTGFEYLPLLFIIFEAAAQVDVPGIFFFTQLVNLP